MSSENVAVADTLFLGAGGTVTAMVTKKRVPIGRPPASKGRPVYVREWRRYMGGKAIDCAVALDIERESYLRLERTPYKFNNGEMAVLAVTIGVKPNQFWFPPPVPVATRISLDDFVEEIPDPVRELIVRAVRRSVGK